MSDKQDKSATEQTAATSTDKAVAQKTENKQPENKKSASKKADPAAKAKPEPVSKAKPVAAKPTAAPTAKPASGGGKLALLLAVLALAAAAYVVYLNTLLNQQLKAGAAQIIANEQALQDQVGAIANLNGQLQAMQQQSQQQVKQNQLQQQQMDGAIQQALEQIAQQQNENQQQLPKWELAEAEYLLRLANQRLAMEQNPAVALPLLQSADEIMRLSEQLGSYGVRKAIATDMAALSGVAVADVEGVYARLAALALQTGKLTYVAPTAIEVETDTAQEQAAPAEVLVEEGQTITQQVWSVTTDVAAATWQELSDLVTIQQRVGSDQMLLTPEKESLQRMRMELAFAQAQAALLRGQQGVYSQALDLAASILHDYYRPDDAVAKAMLVEIVNLQSVQVMVAMPDISGSLLALQKLQAAIHQQGE
jgi:uroporphyrin-3 C-methyltransferase